MNRKQGSILGFAVLTFLVAGLLWVLDAHMDPGQRLLPVTAPRCAPSSAEGGASMLDLTLAGSRCKAAAIVQGWGQAGRLQARRFVLLSVAMICAYTAWLVWACWLARRLPRYRSAALWLASFALVAGGLALAKNVFLWRMVGGAPTRTDADWARSLYLLKWPFVAVAFTFATCAVAGWCWNQLWPPERPEVDPFDDGAPSPASPTEATAELDERTYQQRIGGWLLADFPEPPLPPPAYVDMGIPGQRGVCCSGGGIRSAAYNLGALQALDEAGELAQTRYLAAVSGGAYIASAYILVRDRSDPQLTEPPFARGSPEERFLRSHCSYLAPGVTGKLALLWRMCRGLILNLSLIALALVVLGLPAGWRIAAVQRPAGPPGGSDLTLVAPTTVRLAKNTVAVVGPGRLVELDSGSYVTVEPVRLRVGRTTEAVPSVADDQDPAGRRLAAGLDVPLESQFWIAVAEARGVALLPGRPLVLASGEEIPAAEGTVDIPRGSQVNVTTDAVLRLGGDAIVAPRGRRPTIARRCGDTACVDHGVGAPIWWCLGTVLGFGAVLGLADLLGRPRKRVAAFFEAWTARLLVSGLVGCLVLVGLPELVTWAQNWQGSPTARLGRVSIGAVFAVVAAIVADGLGARSLTGSGVPAGKVSQAFTKTASAVGKGLRMAFVSLVGAVIGPLAIVAAFVGLAIKGATDHATVEALTVTIGALLLLMLLWLCGDLTRWSMHPFYRRRLASAFSLRRYEHPVGIQRAEELNYDRPPLLKELSGALPELIICAAANVTTPGVASPGRPVQTFTFSRNAIGGGLFGSLAPEELERFLGGAHLQAATVPTAVAISGAALSPAMGKLTKRRYTFLMALANIRLGVWLPNPLVVRSQRNRVDAAEAKVAAAQQVADVNLGELQSLAQLLLPFGPVNPDAAVQLASIASLHRTRLAALHEAQAALVGLSLERDRERRRSRRWSIARPHYLLNELFGLNSYRTRFVYVSDGGHYENLGLVELLRRGCTQIYCFDASGDQVDIYTTLGQAVALARSELGVEIAIDPEVIAPKVSYGVKRVTTDHIVGTIKYCGEDAPSGWIIFAKLGVTDEAPWDVRAFQIRYPRFPTQGTQDQLYTDERFEAYRVLGHYTAGKAATKMNVIRSALSQDPQNPAPAVAVAQMLMASDRGRCREEASEKA